MLVSLDGVSKSFGDKLIFDKMSVTIDNNDKIGLIGGNGIGKSTLINIICNKLDYDFGTVAVSNFTTIGLLEQDSGLNNNFSIIDEIRSVFFDLFEIENRLRELEVQISNTNSCDLIYDKLLKEYEELSVKFEINGGYNIPTKIKTILNGMGFGDKDYNTLIGVLSGGEKTRLALAKLLLEEPNLLILDEPTNHLDFKTLIWLENYLSEYNGGLLVVSHDRYFLDKMVGKIWEIENYKIITYKGNYSKFRALRQERIDRELKEYQQYENRASAMIDYARKNIARASTANMAKSRLHQLDNMEKKEKPTEFINAPNFEFNFSISSVKDLLSVDLLKLAVGENDNKFILSENIVFDIKKGDKVALIGANGIGKSTLLKTIQGKLDADGKVIWGRNANISYYEQDNSTLNPEDTVLEAVWAIFPILTQYDIRSMLGRVGITGDNVFKKTGVLSGGQKARVSFAIIMLRQSNTLILDEPTNHLDLEAKEALEQSLIYFDGSLIFVSHDRYFLNRIPNKIIELTRYGLNFYNGNFDFYLSQQKDINKYKEDVNIKKEKFEYRSKKDRSNQVKYQNEVKKLEQDIILLEEDIKNIEFEIQNPNNMSDFNKLQELCTLLEEKKYELETKLNNLIDLNDSAN